MGAQILPFLQVPKWRKCCWSNEHTPSSKSLSTQCLVQSGHPKTLLGGAALHEELGLMAGITHKE